MYIWSCYILLSIPIQVISVDQCCSMNASLKRWTAKHQSVHNKSCLRRAFWLWVTTSRIQSNRATCCARSPLFSGFAAKYPRPRIAFCWEKGKEIDEKMPSVKTWNGLYLITGKWKMYILQSMADQCRLVWYHVNIIGRTYWLEYQ